MYQSSLTWRMFRRRSSPHRLLLHLGTMRPDLVTLVWCWCCPYAKRLSLIPRPSTFIACSTKFVQNLVLQATNAQGLKMKLQETPPPPPPKGEICSTILQSLLLPFSTLTHSLNMCYTGQLACWVGLGRRLWYLKVAKMEMCWVFFVFFQCCSQQTGDVQAARLWSAQACWPLYTGMCVASSPGHFQILSRSCGKFSPQLQDKIWEWPADEASIYVHH